MRMRAGLVFLLAATLSAAELDLLPPGSKMAVGIRLKPLMQLIDSAGAMQQLRQQAAFIKIPGFDPFEDIDEVVLATESEAQNAPSLMVLSGRFPLLLATAMTPKRYKEYPIYEMPSQPGQILAILDAGTALGGDRSLVEQAIDRRGGEGKLPAAFLQRIGALAERYEIWGFGDSSKHLSPTPQFQSVDRFTFGASLQHGLDLMAEIHAAAPKEAKELRDAVTLLQGMMKVGLATQSKSAAKFDISMKDGTLKLAMSIPEAEWKKAVDAQKGALSQALAARTGAGKAPSKPTPERIVTDGSGNTVSLTLPGKK